VTNSDKHLKDCHENASNRSATIYLIEANSAPYSPNIRKGDAHYADSGMYCYGRKNKNIMCMVWYVSSEMWQVKYIEVGLGVT
jgi:hypothetical protein